MAKFDWWQGTIRGANADRICVQLADQVGLADIAPATPRNGYERGARIVRGDHTHAEVWWGGNPGVHVKLTGEHAAEHADWLRGQGAEPSRVDACEDFQQVGLADELFHKATAYALTHNIKLSHQGDWARNHGRTLYLGARSSTAQLVIYEKGHQLGADPNWVRVEARLYPKRRSRSDLARLSADKCMGASPWIGKLLELWGWENLQSLRLGTVWRPSDTERARAALLRQYGRIIRSWADDVGGWERLGPAMIDAIEKCPDEVE